MKNGWNFFVGLAAGFLLALGLTGFVFSLNLGVHSVVSRWAYQITQKKRLLARQTPPPRLLLVGGSATLFGLNARELESQTGWRTLNLASHAALGTAYLLREAQQLAQPGDTVLLVPEYELYVSGPLTVKHADPLLIDYIVARAPDFFHDLSLPEQWNVLMLTPNKRLRQGLKNRKRPEVFGLEGETAVYSVSRIDQWGDQTGHAEACRPDATPLKSLKACSLARPWNESPAGFPFLAAFCAWARTNHVRLLATYPNLMDNPLYHAAAARENAQKIAAFYSRLGVPVVGEYTDAILPAGQFFDTVYHLTEEAAMARTRRLAGQLKPLLPKRQESVLSGQ